MAMDLSDLQALMGGMGDESSGGSGGVWVVSADGTVDDGILRLVGKARSVADALGTSVQLLRGCGGENGDSQRAVRGGADGVHTAGGVPTVEDLVSFFQERSPQAVLFPRDAAGRLLGPALAQALGGSLAGLAADVVVDPIYQRIVAHQPVLDDAARQQLTLTGSPAVIVVDTAALPEAFDEGWRNGAVQDTGLAWPEAPLYAPADLPRHPVTLQNAPVVVAAGLGLKDEAGFMAARRLAEALGGVVAGDVAALDMGWITENELVGLTGHSVAPRLFIALGIDGDSSQFMAIQAAGCVVAVQPDEKAPFVAVADYNVIGDPKEFAEAMVAALGK